MVMVQEGGVSTPAPVVWGEGVEMLPEAPADITVANIAHAPRDFDTKRELSTGR